MSDLRDLVALSLLWTEGISDPARQRPPRSDSRSRSRRTPPPAPAPVSARTLRDLYDALEAIGASDRSGQAEQLRSRAERAMAIGAARGLVPVPRGDGGYPGILATIPDPPTVLWVKGRLDPYGQAVAVVGSRAATPHALEVGRRLGEGLAHAGLVVVSGLARGVDSAAHAGALGAQGQTIAVLGCGADVVYPPEHDRLAARIAESGAIVSEFAPGSPPEAWHFPRRNRIISGLSLGVVVVEASTESGSLITASCALEQSRAVMAVPGGVLSGRNRGAHALIKDGARVVEDIDDVLQELKLELVAHQGAGPVVRHPTNDPILRVMAAGELYDLASLCDATGLDPVKALPRLAELELSGWIQRAGGGRFVKPGKNVLT